MGPLYAGLIALINARLNKRAGYLNPALYGKAEALGVFRDITAGGVQRVRRPPGYLAAAAGRVPGQGKPPRSA